MFTLAGIECWEPSDMLLPAAVGPIQGPMGLYDALARQINGRGYTQLLPVAPPATRRRRTAMFDYDPAKAKKVDLTAEIAHLYW